MDYRAAKLALARKKLKDHQDKKLCVQKDDLMSTSEINAYSDEVLEILPQHVVDYEQDKVQDETVMSNSNQNVIANMKAPEMNLNVTEILISNKRNLETEVNDLQLKLSQLESTHALLIKDYKQCNEQVTNLGNELQNISNKYENATRAILVKDTKINELINEKVNLSEENSNLVEQLEFTKTVLSAKEAENDSLHSQLYNIQTQYDVLQLQLQQLTNGSFTASGDKTPASENNELLLQKISSLEQQLTLIQKERDQIHLHYEHYVSELNEQLKSITKKNDELTSEVHRLSNRENSLIEQIGDMEIRIQNYNLLKKETETQQHSHVNHKELLEDFTKIQETHRQLCVKHEELQKQYAVSVAQIKELSEVKQAECNHDNISLLKLNADMTSDKIAAQRATEQNKKLKQDLQGLEDAFVKMSKDKLELTEKLTAEKYLNRELTIKLAEIDEQAKDMSSKLKAKDEEMIRLQASYRTTQHECHHHNPPEDNVNKDCKERIQNVEDITEHEHSSCNEHKDSAILTDDKNSRRIAKEDAMVKLQERFLKIMGEVADLSDEKHRLEHIILQLQNETDTICEYVALYQQQRSLLKRRDEERSAQLKLFQQECGKLKCQLEELSIILIRFAEDKELASYFLNQAKRNDLQLVMNLLTELKNNSLIDPIKKSVDFKNFYPCNCCSGKLIDV